TVGSALGSPRYAQALAEGRDLPPALSSVHPRFGTPYVAIAATTLVTAALGAAFTYRELVGFSNVTVVLQYALTCAAVPILRRRAGATKQTGFRVPGGLALPLLGVVGSVALLAGASKEELSGASGGITVGIVIALATRHVSKKSA